MLYALQQVDWVLSSESIFRPMNHIKRAPQVPVLNVRRSNFILDGTKRRVNKQGALRLSVQHPYRVHPLFSGIEQPMLVRRNHRFYFPSGVVVPAVPAVPAASYDGELMLALYKNAVLTQYHPERSEDGRRFIQNWLLMF